MNGPVFLITIDTEGDNLWSRPEKITTRNADFLPRFQSLCEKHGFLPTWLVNREMVESARFRSFGRDVLARKCGEIGMHLHAWNSPPIVRLTDDDNAHMPYLIEYPSEVMRAKIETLTSRLEEAFGTKMVSHRAGRWAFNGTYARILVDFGYRVECSVTPGVSWRSHRGAPQGKGGSDYRGFPESPYYLDPNDVASAGDSPLLEVPVTIVPGRAGRILQRFPMGGWSAKQRLASRWWLRPNGRNLGAMMRILELAAGEGRPCVEFMLHSSELMPGGSPTFPTTEHITRLYDDLETLFEAAEGRFVGMTLGEFERCFRASHAGPNDLELVCGAVGHANR